MKQRQSKDLITVKFCRVLLDCWSGNQQPPAVCRKPLALAALHQPSLILAPCRDDELKTTLFCAFCPARSLRPRHTSLLHPFPCVRKRLYYIQPAAFPPAAPRCAADKRRINMRDIIICLFWVSFCPLAHGEMTSHLIYYLSEQFPDAFMVTIVSLKSFSTQHDVHLMNDGPVGVRSGCSPQL